MSEVAPLSDPRIYPNGCQAHTNLERVKVKRPEWRYEVERVGRNQWVVLAYDKDDKFLGYV